MKLFKELNIGNQTKKALDEIGFTEMTEVQAKSIAPALEGKDIIVQSITGSGKTAAFGVPATEKVERQKGIQAVIIGPTRELVNQVSDEMKKFGKYRGIEIATIFGGVSLLPQEQKLKRAEIVVGTPGRMLDHMQRGNLKLDQVKLLILDEADRMLDMGFIDDIKKIISQTPESRQTLLFSATMPSEIVRIANRFMKNPTTISGEKQISPHLLKQYYYDISHEEKISLLEYSISKEKPTLAMVFCATRQATDFVARELSKLGIEATAIHGGLSQNRRTAVLGKFHEGKLHILVATDVAARGLDIKNVSHVFNYDLPKTFEDYTHRIGRTARQGKSGKTISLLSQRDHESFRQISRNVKIEKLSTPKDFQAKKIFFKSERRFPQRRQTRGPPRGRSSGPKKAWGERGRHGNDKRRDTRRAPSRGTGRKQTRRR